MKKNRKSIVNVHKVSKYIPHAQYVYRFIQYDIYANITHIDD